MSDPMISEVTHNAISSQGSVDGLAPSLSQGGRQTGRSGPEVALVNHSVPQVNKEEQQMNDISGQSGSISSASVNLQLSLENKLARQFHTDGSMECRLIWKKKVTPSGRRYCQLAPSMRPISEIDFGLWRSPDTGQGGTSGLLKEGKTRRENGQPIQVRLCDQAAMFPTPTQTDALRCPSPDFKTKNITLNHAALWATQNTMDGMDARSPEAMKRQFGTARKGRTAPADLREQVHPELYPAALWPTSATRDHKDTGNLQNSMVRKDGKSRLDTLPRLTFGLTQNGSSAVTEKQGVSLQLNPAFAFWLMGYPKEWVSSAQQGMQSYQKSRRGSSKHQSKETT